MSGSNVMNQSSVFTVTWKIKNFSHCIQKKGEFLKSPSFQVGNFGCTEWHLRLYPRGVEDDKEIGFFLYREEDKGGPETIAIDFELCVITADDSPEICVEVKDHLFQAQHGFGSSSFATRCNVLKQDKDVLLPDDILTVRCRMWCHDTELLTNEASAECTARTLIGIEKGTFDWSLRDFSSLRVKRDPAIIAKSPTMDCRMRWQDIEPSNYEECIAHDRIGIADESSFNTLGNGLSPRRLNEDRTIVVEPLTKDYPSMTLRLFLTGGYLLHRNVQIEISQNDGKRPSLVALLVHVLSAYGTVLESAEGKHWFDEKDGSQTWKFPTFITREMLVGKKSVYLPGDVLTLRCECVLSVGVESEEIEPKSVHEPSFQLRGLAGPERNHERPQSSYATRHHDQSSHGSRSFTEPKRYLEFPQNEPAADQTHYSQSPLQSQSNAEPGHNLDTFQGPSTTSLHSQSSSQLQSYARPERKFRTRPKFPAGRDLIESSQSFRSDMQNLYEDEIFSDFTITTDFRSFAVHKAVLSVRSPVFRTMFSSEMMEQTGNFVEVPDVDSDTMHRFLLHAYSDTFEENMEWSDAKKLYFAADKYEVLPLKQKCAARLKNCLCPDNALEILVLADMHQDEHLKKAVQDFILEYDHQIIGSEVWKQFEIDEPGLLLETVRETYLRKLRYEYPH